MHTSGPFRQRRERKSGKVVLWNSIRFDFVGNVLLYKVRVKNQPTLQKSGNVFKDRRRSNILAMNQQCMHGDIFYLALGKQLFLNVVSF